MIKRNLLIAFAFLAILMITSTGCKVGRFVWYNFSNITDYKIFPSRPMNKPEVPFLFTDAQQNNRIEDQIQIMNSVRKAYSLKDFLEESPTVAFLVIRNDSLLYERYFDGYADSSTVASFSVAKSFISALIGIAIHEGKIKSEDDKVTDYVPELGKTEGWDKVTIHHLLQMSSGVEFSEKYYTPFSGAATFYYGRKLRKKTQSLKLAYDPMTRFEYKSANTQLLGLILERATGMSNTQYLEEKLWKPLGMEFDGTWSIDRKKNGLEKSFCCINAKARDFAKFGRLYLNKGNWNGRQVIPEDWVIKSTSINKEKGAAWFFNRQWWIGSEVHKDFSAIGHLGQYIYVLPEKNMVIVRLGKGRAEENWIEVMRQVAVQL